MTDLFSVLDFAGVQKRVLALPGVKDADMTAASSSITVTYDEKRTDPQTIATAIKACGFHSRGESGPNHTCLPNSTGVIPDHTKAHSVAAKDTHAGHAAMTPAEMAAMAAAPAGAVRDATAHEKGHGSILAEEPSKS